MMAVAYQDNCWEWVMQRLDQRIPAKQLVVNAHSPQVGDVAVMEYQKSYGAIAHFAVVEGIYTNGSVLISECNMWHLYQEGCGYRIIDANYPHLKGYYHPEGVYN